MTTDPTATPSFKEIEILTSAALYWLECGKLEQVEAAINEIEDIALNEIAAPTPPTIVRVPTSPSAGELAAALAWSLDTLTELFRPDAEMWECIDRGRELIELAQPSAADRAPFKKSDQ